MDVARSIVPTMVVTRARTVSMHTWDHVRQCVHAIHIFKLMLDYECVSIIYIYIIYIYIIHVNTYIHTSVGRRMHHTHNLASRKLPSISPALHGRPQSYLVFELLMSRTTLFLSLFLWSTPQAQMLRRKIQDILSCTPSSLYPSLSTWPRHILRSNNQASQHVKSSMSIYAHTHSVHSTHIAYTLSYQLIYEPG